MPPSFGGAGEGTRTPMRQRLKTAVERIFRPDRRRRIRPGSLERIDAFKSTYLATPRNILIYLPPNYDARSERAYPVLYLQDGQNLFDPATSFIPGQHWRLREAADALVSAHRIEPPILVGIENAGVHRINEYTPTRDEKRAAGGEAASYGKMLVEELIPLIHERYRAATTPELTGIGGSSLGGLVSLYVGLCHPDVFGHIAAMSPSAWWDSHAIMASIDAYEHVTRPRIWLDIGGREGEEAVRDARHLRDRLIAKGWHAPETLRYVEERHAEHSELAWAKRAPKMLEWMFAKGR
jgi:predicted alpha/beta superfamily hydrolase